MAIVYRANLSTAIPGMIDDVGRSAGRMSGGNPGNWYVPESWYEPQKWFVLVFWFDWRAA